jgi:predicted acylesterase/phospholipase RssA
MKRPIKVVASGSGTRYPVQIGAICQLLDYGLDPDEALGTSGGGIAAAAVAKYRTSKELEQLALDVLPRNFLTRNWFPFGGRAGIYKMSGFINAFRRYLHRNIEDSEVGLHIVATNWTKGEVDVFTSGALAPRLAASMCLPIFDMVEIGDNLYEDGGTSMNFAIDYQGWKYPMPNMHVIGLKVRGRADFMPRPSPLTKLHRAAGSIERLIAANDREHIEDAHWANVIMLDTAAPGVDLNMGPDEVKGMLNEGRQAVVRAHVEGRLG